ncbi:bifunctional 3-(3-hydroxy-phenyl)propionate/3-hydroxycinnamic acid hydroxylase [Arthrobacter sp. MAHUQ-56]|nr:bifunctional 3-(3-hydroxy-phenyl)propionate/3-hydroxycinnamic acid hydroxylase [Arthrobacter sp. MAHUQ-56]MBX7445911.1 bifunctional 3-(3-hydroxy-phenyl)propionate/3-hydroxycinnamic acid hydroxylase [Arthrobacter sp. MAHUQ-56]
MSMKTTGGPGLHSADVTIVGFGPVGKLLALQLGRRGHRVLVVDRKETGYPLPRAVTHCSDFARILQSVGLSPDRIPEVTEPYDDMYVWRNGQGQTLVEVDWSGRGESGWYNTYFFNQPALEDRLDALVEDLPTVTVLRGWEAGDVSQDKDSIRVNLNRTSSGEQITAVSSWLIGADGANSAVRQLAGIEWHDEGFFYDWLVVDVKPGPGLDFPHVASQLCDTSRPATMVPGGPGRRRWEFMRLPGETKEELNRTEKAWELLAPYGVTADNAELERHSVYTFQACWATEWRHGRILLAGDAAHLMPPFAGQGLGAGVRDAMNLAWKLGAVLDGLADDSLLDTYGPERSQHAIAFVKFSVNLGQVICLTDHEEAAERDERMIAEWASTRTAPAPPRPGLGHGLHTGPHGGELAIQGRVTSSGKTAVLLDDLLGGPGVLLTRRSSMLTDISGEDQKRLGLLEIRMASLEDNGDVPAGVEIVHDTDGTYRRWLDSLGTPHAPVDAVLIRPDFHLYGTAAGNDAKDLARGFLAGLHTCHLAAASQEA